MSAGGIPKDPQSVLKYPRTYDEYCNTQVDIITKGYDKVNSVISLPSTKRLRGDKVPIKKEEETDKVHTYTGLLLIVLIIVHFLWSYVDTAQLFKVLMYMLAFKAILGMLNCRFPSGLFFDFLSTNVWEICADIAKKAQNCLKVELPRLMDTFMKNVKAKNSQDLADKDIFCQRRGGGL